MKKLLYAGVILLLVLHQDAWLWRDRTLVLGFLPVGLFYHACYTLAAALLMWLLATYAWPTHLDEDARKERH